MPIEANGAQEVVEVANRMNNDEDGQEMADRINANLSFVMTALFL